MRLYLVQHAEARREEEDPARDLTEKGRRDMVKMADYLGRLTLEVSRLWHSGKTRARSTAAALAAALKPRQGISEAAGLAPLNDPEEWAARLAGLDEDIMLVGHLPHLARLAALLLTGDQEKSVIDFQMGGVVCLRRREGGPWAVAWMLLPEILP